jgi:transposase InsO family protein
VSKARLVITAVVVEGRAVSEVVEAYRVSRSWAYELVARYRAQGETAFEAQSRRPLRSPTATSATVVALICELRARLVAQGLDSGADTIAWHLEHDHGVRRHPATIHRILVRAGLVVPAPKKRPKASYRRFEAALANECWQSDFTHSQLADGSEVEVLAWIDDCSRYVLRLTAHARVTGRIVVDEFRTAMREHGVPASTLTDNGMVFTTRFSGGRGGRNGFEAELHRLGIQQKNSRANHPTTCGKVERFHQTVKKFLAQQDPPATLPGLQAHLDRFVDYYNTIRPHRSIGRRTPYDAFCARTKSHPRLRGITVDGYRLRHDTIDRAGKITIRSKGRLHHIGLGRPHAGQTVAILIAGRDIRVLTEDGQLLRQLVLDPTRDYQPQKP